jgi:hypothetical protein
MGPLDLNDFKMKRDGNPNPPMSRRPPRHKAGEWFLKGPIPGQWLVRASDQSPTGLRVGLVLWYLAGVTRSCIVKPTWDAWRRFGLSPDAGRRGLGDLEEAGLVDVDRKPGCCPLVTIRDAGDGQSCT